MNNFNNCNEKNIINTQLERADIQKSRLIRNIYKEYELYLNFVRDQLFISVEKGLNDLCSDSSINNVFLNSDELLCFFEKKISNLIYSKLPLITIEQLKINKKVEENNNKENNFNSLEKSLKTTFYQKAKFQYDDGFQLEDTMQFHISEDISKTSEYYQAEIHSQYLSLDLDKYDYINYLSNNHINENIGLEREFISSLIELIEEVKIEKPRYFEDYNINQIDSSPKHQSLINFNLIERSLENLLLNLSYKINLELFKANLIKKMISQDSFEYLVGKKLMIEHPHPFIINFELNLNQSSSSGDYLPNIVFLNISTIELEYKNLNLSFQRNRINELKNQFQRLIKKERYWRQKEISLNKIH